METRQIQVIPDGRGGDGAGAAERARESASADLRAAIALVAAHPLFRVIVCGLPRWVALQAEVDSFATDAGVVLERRVRPGSGGIDVLVRAA